MEKNKIIIGIDIDEVLRQTWSQFDRYYCNEFGEEGAPEDPFVFDYFNTYKWEGKTETIKILRDDVPEDISPLEYALDENGESNADYLLFDYETNHYEPVDVYNKFMYEDYLFEIFGTAPPTYSNLISDLKKLILNTPECEYIIFSNHKQITIAPTLFFLSKISSHFKTYKFYDNRDDVWSDCNIVITSDPYLLNNVPEDKKVVKVKRPYNFDCKCDTEILQISDLFDNLNKIIN